MQIPDLPGDPLDQLMRSKTKFFSNPSMPFGHLARKVPPKSRFGRPRSHGRALGGPGTDLGGPGKPLGLAFKEKTIILEPQKLPETAWAPHGWLLEKKGSFGEGGKKPPEAACAPHGWHLRKKDFFGGPNKNRGRQPGHRTAGF